MDLENITHFSLVSFTNITKQVCMCSALSIFIIVLFIISPLSNFLITSVCMKTIALALLVYTLYLNHKQTEQLKNANLITNAPNIKSQLNMNILCSYVFTFFVGLLILSVLKSFLF